MSTEKYTPYYLYSNVAKRMLARGYICDYHGKLIDAVHNNDQEKFMDVLNEYENHPIQRVRSEITPLNHFEKLISVWKKGNVARGDTEAKQHMDYSILLYFANHANDGKKINKEEIVLAYNYLTKLKVRSMNFIHIDDLPPTTSKHLEDPQIIPSKKRYRIEITQANSFDIDVNLNFWVPNHKKVENPSGFYEREGIHKGSLPKISIHDPAIAKLAVSPGDIIEIERLEEFDGIKTLAFREVQNIPIDKPTTKKN